MINRDKRLQRLAALAEPTRQVTKTSEDSRRSVYGRMALRDVLNVALAGAGVGVGARGGAELIGLLRRNLSPVDPPSTDLREITMPRFDRDDDEDKPRWGRRKLSQDKRADNPVTAFFRKAFKGDVQSRDDLWWAMPSRLLAGGGSILAGWKAMDNMMDNRQEEERDKELERAREKFQRALMDASSRPKAAADDGPDLGRELDQLYDQLHSYDLEKQSANVPARLVSGYLSMMLLPTLAAWYYGHNQAQKGDRSDILEKAMKERQRERAQTRPISLVFSDHAARPPVSTGVRQDKDDEEDETGSGLTA